MNSERPLEGGGDQGPIAEIKKPNATSKESISVTNRRSTIERFSNVYISTHKPE